MVRPDTDDMIAFLNALLEIDRYAIAELLTVRVLCNQELADHPSVQVSGSEGTTFVRPGTFRVGMLGILNGYCGTLEGGERDSWGPISAVYEEGQLARFERTTNSTASVTT